MGDKGFFFFCCFLVSFITRGLFCSSSKVDNTWVMFGAMSREVRGSTVAFTCCVLLFQLLATEKLHD